jgi:hypothetical protein
MSKSYDTITKEMMEYMEDETKPQRSDVMMWFSEFGELNYDNCKKIIKILEDEKNFEKDEEGENQLKPLKIKAIKDLGEKINKRGGFRALQANYYTMLNFMISDSKVMQEVKLLNYYWDGVGKWKM